MKKKIIIELILSISICVFFIFSALHLKGDSVAPYCWAGSIFFLVRSMVYCEALFNLKRL